MSRVAPASIAARACSNVAACDRLRRRHPPRAGSAPTRRSEPARRHRDLAQSAVGRDQKPLNQVGIGIAKKGRIVCPAVLAGEEWALEVDPKDCRVSPGLGRAT